MGGGRWAVPQGLYGLRLPRDRWTRSRGEGSGRGQRAQPARNMGAPQARLQGGGSQTAVEGPPSRGTSSPQIPPGVGREADPELPPPVGEGRSRGLSAGGKEDRSSAVTRDRVSEADSRFLVQRPRTGDFCCKEFRPFRLPAFRPPAWGLLSAMTGNLYTSDSTFAIVVPVRIRQAVWRPVGDTGGVGMAAGPERGTRKENARRGQ